MCLLNNRFPLSQSSFLRLSESRNPLTSIPRTRDAMGLRKGRNELMIKALTSLSLRLLCVLCG